MATYKVLQDIEAEDKLVGPLTLRQCIYAAIAAIGLYLSYLVVVSHLAFLVVLFLPFIAFGVFFAFPWNKQQSTEIWALAKVRFILKPRKRIWDQSGMKDLVTVTAPKQLEDPRRHRMTETEVRSRLQALAATVDSRGWAIKNVPMDMYGGATVIPSSDRLTGASATSQGIAYKESSSDDIFDMDNNPIAQQFEAKITAASQAHHQQLVAQMANPQALPAAPAASQQSYGYPQPAQTQPTYAVSNAAPFSPVPVAAAPTPEEEAFAQRIKQQHAAIGESRNNAHLRVILPLAQQQAQAAQQQALAAQQLQQQAAQVLQTQQQSMQSMGYTTPGQPAMPTAYTMPQPAVLPPASAVTTPFPPIAAATPTPVMPANPPVTPTPNPAILELANNNDLNVATIAREAQHRNPNGGVDEVVISLH